MGNKNSTSVLLGALIGSVAIASAVAIIESSVDYQNVDLQTNFERIQHFNEYLNKKCEEVGYCYLKIFACMGSKGESLREILITENEFLPKDIKFKDLRHFMILNGVNIRLFSDDTGVVYIRIIFDKTSLWFRTTFDREKKSIHIEDSVSPPVHVKTF